MSRTLLTSVVVVAGTVAALSGQTRVSAPSNKYTPAQDVEMGLQAASEVRQQLPLMKDDQVTSYIESLGGRLTAVIPPEYQHTEFKYTFEAVNVREINAFALPGGPMFVNRGMLEAAGTEGEVVGVMAHEVSHVLLRHGTAQASKASRYQIGAAIGAIAGAVIGGRTGSAVSQATQFGFGTMFLRYGREYEKQADILGAQLMTRAGYDARDMANMFRTIQKQGSNGPEWLSDHPDPGNRVAYIEKEAQGLPVSNPVTDRAGFDRVRAHLKSLPPAPSSEEAAKSKPANTSNNSGSTGGVSTGGASTTNAPRGSLGRVEPPSGRYREYTEGNLFRIAVPNNWREMPASTAVTFAPDGAFGQVNGQNVFTHGIETGVARNERHELPQATQDFIAGLTQGNPRLVQQSSSRNAIVAGRPALQTLLQNVSDASGQPETIQLVTTRLRDGSLFYLLAVVPDADARAYDATFQQIVRSLRLND